MNRRKLRQHFDLSDYEKGQPIKIDVSTMDTGFAKQCLRSYLHSRGHKNLYFYEELEKRGPYRSFLICDWQSNKTPEERLKEHPYYKFKSEGVLHVPIELDDEFGKVNAKIKAWIKRHLDIDRQHVVITKKRDSEGNVTSVFYNSLFEAEDQSQ